MKSQFRVSNTLAMSTFKQEIGQWSLIIVAPGQFGTRKKIIVLAAEGRKPYEKKNAINDNVLVPSKCHIALKNPKVRPSSHGDLFCFSLWRIEVISTAEGILIIGSFKCA